MKESILIFGGGDLQISIIEKVMRLGFNSVVIDPNPNALAKDISDVFIQVGGDDFSKTLAIANEYKVKGVVTAATDHPILMMSRIAAELQLSFPNFNSCDILLDKGKFKTFLNNNNLPHAKGGVFESSGDFDQMSYGFPVIVKPVKNSGSRGVIKCEGPEGLANAIAECIPYCRDGRFIVEEFIEGDEISVEAIVFKGLVEIIQITDKFVSPPPYNVEMGHIQPSKYLNKQDEITGILQKIITNTGFDNCVIHPEFKINENGDIVIIEVGTRLGGDYITSDLTPLSTNVDIEALQIYIAIDKPLEYERLNMCSAISFLSLPEGRIIKENIDELELIGRFPEITRFYCKLKIGDTVNKITNSLERYGYFIIQSKSVEELKNSCLRINQFLQTKFLFND